MEVGYHKPVEGAGFNFLEVKAGAWRMYSQWPIGNNQMIFVHKLEELLPGNFLGISTLNTIAVSRTKHIWYSEHGMYCRFEIILERAMSATHVAVILHMRTSPAYEEEFTKMDYPDARNEYGTS